MNDENFGDENFGDDAENAELKESILVQDDAQVLLAVKELLAFFNSVVSDLNGAAALIETNTFKYLSVDSRRVLLDKLATNSDKADDMSRAVIKGIRRIKRVKLRDDDVIAKLAHNWAVTQTTSLE